jgi:Domain of unknown function (DUF5664)
MGTGVKLPTDPKERKKIPIYSGVLKYFPDAIAAVAAVSFAGNEQHNPGEPLHWARHKSTDQEDTLARHLMEAGSIDSDGHRHSAKAAWRALAILQLEIEAARADEKTVTANAFKQRAFAQADYEKEGFQVSGSTPESNEWFVVGTWEGKTNASKK